MAQRAYAHIHTYSHVSITPVMFKKKLFKPGFEGGAVKCHCEMAVGRIKLRLEKIHNIVKVQRRALAELLATGKYDAARVRVEACMREDLSIEGYEVLSLFLELLMSRMQLLADSKPLSHAGKGDAGSFCPPELKEAVTSVLWASARLGSEVPELMKLRKAFTSKFGSAFVEMAINNSEHSVNQRIIERIGSLPPSNDMSVAYLGNIATEFGIANFDETKFSSPAGVLTSANADKTSALLSGQKGYGSNILYSPSGVAVPATVTAQDAIDQRIIHLKSF